FASTICLVHCGSTRFCCPALQALRRGEWLQQKRTAVRNRASVAMNTNDATWSTGFTDANDGLPVIAVQRRELCTAAAFARKVASEVIRCDLMRMTLRNLGTGERCPADQRANQQNRERA